MAYTYDDDGRLSAETLPGGLSRSYAYASDRLSRYTETRSGTPRVTDLDYFASGLLRSETTGTTAKAYTYTPDGQLKTASDGAATTTYEYDPVGNRTAEIGPATRTDYTYDPQLTQQLLRAEQTPVAGGVATDTVAYEHDDAGRLTKATDTRRTRTTAYDVRGLPTSITTADKVTGSTWSTTRGYDAEGFLTSTAFRAPGSPNPRGMSLTWDRAAAVPQVAQIDADNLLYGANRAMVFRPGRADAFSYDAHGSALATDATADLVRAGSYDEWGAPPAPALETGIEPFDPAKDQDGLFGYRGELHLDATVHLRARDYGPNLGRFTTEDPVEGQPGIPTYANPYPYAANDPLGKIDPLGLTPLSDAPMKASKFLAPWLALKVFNAWLTGGAPYLWTAFLKGLNPSEWATWWPAYKSKAKAAWAKAVPIGPKFWDAFGEEFAKGAAPVQALFDALGFLPVVGEPFDLASCGISAAAGDAVGAGLSCTAALPFLGWGAGVAKVGKRIDSAIDAGRMASGEASAIVRVADFSDDSVAFAHYSKHVKGVQLGPGGAASVKVGGPDLPEFASFAEYRSAARAFMGGEAQEGVLEVHRIRDGALIRVDEKTGYFGVRDTSGVIRTFFRPSGDPLEYFWTDFARTG